MGLSGLGVATPDLNGDGRPRDPGGGAVSPPRAAAAGPRRGRAGRFHRVERTPDRSRFPLAGRCGAGLARARALGDCGLGRWPGRPLHPCPLPKPPGVPARSAVPCGHAGSPWGKVDRTASPAGCAAVEDRGGKGVVAIAGLCRAWASCRPAFACGWRCVTGAFIACRGPFAPHGRGGGMRLRGVPAGAW